MDDMDEPEFDEELPPEQEEEVQEQVVKFLPTIEYYKRTYASSITDDRRAIRIFKDFESLERLRRLQGELQTIRNGKVSEVICDRLLGKKRKAKYESYQKWAQLMLLWITSKK